MPVAILRPTGAGSLTEWTPSAGTNWAAVVTVGDSLSAGTATAGRRDRYTFEDLPADATGVTSLSVYGYVQTEAPGGTMRYTVGLSGTESNGATFTPDEGGYGVMSTAFALAPGALAWTVARVNALEAGPDAVTVPGFGLGVSADAVWLAVDYTSSDFVPSGAAKTVSLGRSGALGVDLGRSASHSIPLSRSTSGRLALGRSEDVDIPLRRAVAVPIELQED